MEGEYLEFRGTAFEELSRALLAEQDASRALREELGRREAEVAALRRELQAARAWGALAASGPREEGPETAEARVGESAGPGAEEPVRQQREPSLPGADAAVGRSRLEEEPASREAAVGGSRLAVSTAGDRERDAREAEALRARCAALEAQGRALRRQALQAGTAVRILSAGFTSSLSAFADAAGRLAAVSLRLRRVEAAVLRLVRLQRARRPRGGGRVGSAVSGGPAGPARPAGPAGLADAAGLAAPAARPGTAARPGPAPRPAESPPRLRRPGASGW